MRERDYTKSGRYFLHNVKAGTVDRLDFDAATATITNPDKGLSTCMGDVENFVQFMRLLQEFYTIRYYPRYRKTARRESTQQARAAQ